MSSGGKDPMYLYVLEADMYSSTRNPHELKSMLAVFLDTYIHIKTMHDFYHARSAILRFHFMSNLHRTPVLGSPIHSS